MSDRISRRSSAACRRRAPNWNRRSAPTDWWPAPPARAPRRSQRPARPTRPPRRRPPSNSRWTLATLAASTDTPVTIAHFDSPGFHITWWRATLETHTHTHTHRKNRRPYSRFATCSWIVGVLFSSCISSTVDLNSGLLSCWPHLGKLSKGQQGTTASNSWPFIVCNVQP